MFDGVARRYDMTNTVLSMGQDRRWRRRTRQCLELRPAQRVLDLAAGTAVSTEELRLSGARAIGCDFSLGMLQAGRTNRARQSIPLVAGDAMRLPFRDGVFDAVTISFGLRNVAEPQVALREMARVVRPGGRLVVCEFSRPTFAPFRAVYLNYLMRRAAVDRPARGVEPGRLRLPRRVDPSLAGAAAAGAHDRRERVVRRTVPQPFRRDRRAAPGRPSGGLTPFGT